MMSRRKQLTWGGIPVLLLFFAITCDFPRSSEGFSVSRYSYPSVKALSSPLWKKNDALATGHAKTSRWQFNSGHSIQRKICMADGDDTTETKLADTPEPEETNTSSLENESMPYLSTASSSSLTAGAEKKANSIKSSALAAVKNVTMATEDYTKEGGMWKTVLLAGPLFVKFVIILVIKFVTDLVVFPLLWLYRLARLTKKKIMNLFRGGGGANSASSA